MTREEAKEILLRHNEWRRGGEGGMESPKAIGEAIDVAVEALGSPSEADYTEQMRQLNGEWKENLKIQRQVLIDEVCEVFKRFMQVQYGEDIDESMEMYFREAIGD